jgi:hypothetical protein
VKEEKSSDQSLKMFLYNYGQYRGFDTNKTETDSQDDASTESESTDSSDESFAAAIKAQYPNVTYEPYNKKKSTHSLISNDQTESSSDIDISSSSSSVTSQSVNIKHETTSYRPIFFNHFVFN